MFVAHEKELDDIKEEAVSDGLLGNKNNHRPSLSEYLFWDSDIEQIDFGIRASFILERVFSMGTEEDVKETIKYYGIPKIKKEIVKINFLDKKTLNYLSFTFGIPKWRFLCYKKNVLQGSY
jgi:hypothetical protein